mgnify:CR=1 FL=1
MAYSKRYLDSLLSGRSEREQEEFLAREILAIVFRNASRRDPSDPARAHGEGDIVLNWEESGSREVDDLFGTLHME